MKEISIHEININPATMFGKEWCLIAAGNEKNGYNTMTVAWGQLGAVWDRHTPEGKMIIPTATVFIRPQRYTKEFFDREEYFTVCAFGAGYRKALAYLGTHSGRDGDKISDTGLTPVFIDNTTGFAEAEMIFVCRKLYHTPLLENGFTDKNIISENYPKKDFHEMYVGEITKIFRREDA